MAFDAGAIEATLDLDRDSFQRKLTEAKQQARQFADDKYAPTLDADTVRADAKILDLQARLDRLGRERVSPAVDLDGVTAAEARIAALQAQIDRLDRSGGGFGGGVTGRGGFFSRLPSPSFLSLGIGAALPLAGPLAGVALGAGASFLSPAIAGGIGLGAFGLGAKASIEAVQKDVKELTKLTQQYNAASTNKQRAAVLEKEHALWQSLDPAERQAVKNVDALDASWKRYQKALEPKTFAVLADGSSLLKAGLKDLLPVAKSVGGEIDYLLVTAKDAFTAPFWHDFFGRFLPGEATSAVGTLGTVLGNVGTGFAHLAEDVAPLGHALETELDNLSQRFEQWTEGAGPGKFVAFVEKEGPVVGDALKGIANGLEGVGRGLTPIGEVELKALTPVLNFIGDLGKQHPAVITAVGTALLGVGAGLKVIAGVRGITSVLGGIGQLGGGRGVGGVAGKLGATPVYVTNWPPGFGPTGAVGAAETEAGAAAKAGGAGLLGRVGSKLIAPGIGGAVALTGGTITDTTRRGDIPGAAIITEILRSLRGSPQYAQANSQVRGLVSVGPANTTTQLKALSFVQQFGTPQQVQALAAEYPAVAKALADVNAQQKTLNQLLVVNPGLAKNAAAAQAILGDAISNVTKTISVTGIEGYSSMKQLGQELMDGLLAGVEARTPAVKQQAALTVDSIIKHMRFDKSGAWSGSPSKNAIPIGKDIADGILLGFNDRTQMLVNKMPLGLQQALSALQTKGMAAVQKYQSDLAARTQYETGLSSQLAGTLGGLTITSGSNGGGNGILGALSGQVHDVRQFAGLLATLRRRGLNPTLLQQVADAGTVQGTIDAESLLAGRGTIAAANRDERALLRYSGQAATTVGGAVYGPRLSGDVAAIGHVEHTLEELLMKAGRLNESDMQRLAQLIGRVIVRAMPTIPIKEIDRALGIRVRNAR